MPQKAKSGIVPLPWDKSNQPTLAFVDTINKSEIASYKRIGLTPINKANGNYCSF